MIKKLVELGITPLKCENKEGTENLREIHHRINDIIYPNGGKYIDRKLKEDIYSQLVEEGKKLNDLKVTERAEPKKKELLEKLRKVCLSLKSYDAYLDPTDTPFAQKTINYFIHQFITVKKEITMDIAYTFYKESYRLWEAFNSLEQVNMTSLKGVNNELLEILNRNKIS